MRIACIHIPQFALQCATRLDPTQRGAAVAVVSTTAPASGQVGAGDARMSLALHAPIVIACSRAAWAAGVRLGMTATAVRQLRGEIAVTSVDTAIERETVRAIAEAVLGLTGVVDLGGAIANVRSGASVAASSGAHLAMYAEVPAKTRGHAFGERVLERLEELGLTGRVGIADDRFTAWVAAAHDGAASAGSEADRVTMVPRGGSAAFLAPRPLSLLAISNEVQHMLEALGVRTLGEFAALPAPSVGRRSGLAALEPDYQALARGESGTLLRPYAPEAAIREDIVVRAGNVLDAPVAGGGDASIALSGPSAIALVARRLALRLAGRGRLAAKLEIVRTASVSPSNAADRFETAVTLSPPTAEAEDLARVLAPALDGAGTEWRLRAVIVGEALAGDDRAEAERPMFTLSQELGMPSLELAMAGRQVAAAATRAASAPLAAAAPSQASRAGESLATAARTATPQATDPLSVVLSTSGALFALSSPGSAASDRRELRGRLRRGKSRVARRGRAVTLPGQSRLFERG